MHTQTYVYMGAFGGDDGVDIIEVVSGHVDANTFNEVRDVAQEHANDPIDAAELSHGYVRMIGPDDDQRCEWRVPDPGQELEQPEGDGWQPATIAIEP